MQEQEEEHFFEDSETLNAVFAFNLTRNLKEAREKLGVDLVCRDSRIKIKGGDARAVSRAVKFLKELESKYKSTVGNFEQRDFEHILLAYQRGTENDLQRFYNERIRVSPRKKDIIPRNRAQLDYIRNIREKDVVFGVGPAGTGKTYLAMAMAVSEFLEGKFNRIILTRPAREAGENLGFLPGNLEEKIMPYLRPLYDALYDMLDFEEAASLMEKNIIEVAPLAFMRGRTLNNAFIILDEAQNTTVDQMLMFLTRLGFDSNCVVTGDPSQTDLQPGQVSGLMHAVKTLKKIPEIKLCEFSTADVVRHSLVEKIINAYREKE